MRKSIKICIALAFSFPLILSGQPTEKVLDQAELMKQWIGTWEIKIGDDSVSTIICAPLNNGIHWIQEEKSNGNTYATYRGVMGLSDDKKMIRSQAILLNGTIMFDRGKFVEENKCILDRYFGNTTHAESQVMFEFSPGSFTIRFKQRGEGMNWPKEWSPGMTFKKTD